IAKLVAAISANTIDIAHAENVARRVVACGLHRSCELALITMSPRLRLHPASDGAPAALALCWINLTPGHVKTFPFYRYGMAAIPYSYGCSAVGSECRQPCLGGKVATSVDVVAILSIARRGGRQRGHPAVRA